MLRVLFLLWPVVPVSRKVELCKENPGYLIKEIDALRN